MLRVTPVYGSTGHHPSSPSPSLSPSCTLIEYGGVRVLVNVGCDESLLSYQASSSSQEGEPGVLAVQGPSLGHELPLELPAADAILLTDSSLQSLGGLPIYYGRDREAKVKVNVSVSPAKVSRKVPRKVPPIYSTFPTVKMGQMTLYDHHANISLDGGSPGFTLNDVDSLFSGTQYVTNTQSHTNDNDNNNAPNPHAIQTLKYAQTLILNDPVTNQPALGITPHRAGHLVGASYFVFQRLADETMVVVAPTVHHANEGHLDSSTLDKFGVAADVLITTCGGPGGFLGELYRPPSTGAGSTGTSTGTASTVTVQTTNKATLESPRVKLDESKLVTTILSTLRRGGNVLLPTDASGRVLELVLLLNQHWQSQNLSRAYNLCWVGPMVHNTVEFAKSQLEWMATTLGRQFDTGRGHPYALKHVQMFGSLEEMEVELGLNVLGGDGGEGEATNPTCVLASGATLDYGPARDLFVKWSENMENAVILTDARRCTPRGSVATTKRKTKQVLNANQSLVTPAGGAAGAGAGAAVPSPPTRSTSVSSFGTDTPRMLEEEEATTPVAISGAPGAVSSTLTITSTERVTNQWSTAAQLLQKWCEAKKVHEEMEDVIDVQLLVPHRAPLAGVELTKFQEAEEAQRLKRKKEEERRAMLREVEFAKASLHLGTEEGAAGSSATTSSNSTIKGKKEEDGGGVEKDSSTIRPKKKSRFDASLFLKYSKPCHMTFEVREEAVGIGQPDSIAKYGIGESIGRAGEVLEDDYGISVKAESFVDIVTGVDPSKYAGGSGRIGDEALRRGLGFGSDGRPVIASSGSKGALRAESEGGVGDFNLISDGEQGGEQALEVADLSEGNGIIRGRNNRPPVKVSSVNKEIEVLAEIEYISLEGRCDAKAARQSIRALQPRQIVILGTGKPHYVVEANEDMRNSGFLADAIRALPLTDRNYIFAPTDGEKVELNVGHAAYSVYLVDTPFTADLGSKEQIQRVEPFEAQMGECTVSLLDCVATGQSLKNDGSVVLAPRSIGNESRRPNHVMISNGDVLLTDLRSEIIAQGLKAEYTGSARHAGYTQLIINGKIVVRKDQISGKINVEGPLCEDFFLIRSIVCNQFVTL